MDPRRESEPGVGLVNRAKSTARHRIDHGVVSLKLEVAQGMASLRGAHASQVVGRRPVRAPFRVLAGIIAVLGVVSVFGTLFVIWRGVRAATIGEVLMIPLMIGFIRLMYHAAAYGKSPIDGISWPFASAPIANGYLLLLIAYYLTRSSI